MTLIEKAQQFAHDAHDSILQKRKYPVLVNNELVYEPYWVHTDAVAALVEKTFRDANNGVLTEAHSEYVAAAHLHDIWEDVAPLNSFFNYDLIVLEFGARVARYVKDMTDYYTKERYPQYNRAKRKQLESERFANVTPDLQTLKLADLACNTESIVENDPDFAKVYLKEKMALLPFLTGGSPVLLAKVSEQTLNGFTKLGLTFPTIVAK